MKLSPVLNDHLQMPSIYISQGSTILLTKKKRLLLSPNTLTVRDYVSFPKYFLGSRRTLENLFVRFERALNGVVFDSKISAGNQCAFAGERLKYS